MTERKDAVVLIPVVGSNPDLAAKVIADTKKLLSRKQRQKAHRAKRVAGPAPAPNTDTDTTYKGLRCLRCSCRSVGFMAAVCESCFAKSPKLTSEEKSHVNVWDTVELLERIAEIGRQERGDTGYWNWAMNTDCKYLDIRVDMRDGGCIVKDQAGRRIGIDTLNWQYSAETPERPKT